jgi:hypothetical protein
MAVLCRVAAWPSQAAGKNLPEFVEFGQKKINCKKSVEKKNI